MTNLKKLLAICLILTMLTAVAMPAYAADDAAGEPENTISADIPEDISPDAPSENAQENDICGENPSAVDIADAENADASEQESDSTVEEPEEELPDIPDTTGSDTETPDNDEDASEREEAPDTEAEPEENVPAEEENPQDVLPGEDSSDDTAAPEENADADSADTQDEVGADELEEEISSASVCYISSTGTGYATLAEAVEAATAGDTIILTADIEAPERIVVGKNLTITDDGDYRSIYCCNTSSTGSSAGGYGRGIQIQSSATLNITGTESGGIGIIGQSSDGSAYNTGAVLHIYSGTLKLTNVKIRECCVSGDRGSIYVESGKKVYLTGCSITDCYTSGDNGGAAIYSNGGTIYLQDGTVITDNTAKSSLAGAIYSSGNCYVSGKLDISGNLKGVTGSVKGLASDIMVASSSQLYMNGNLSGYVGIDYTGDSTRRFGTMSVLSYTGYESFFCNCGQLYPYNDSGKLYWTDAYSIVPGSETDRLGFSYKLGNAALELAAGSAYALSILVENGSFVTDSATIPTGAKVYCVKENGQFSASVPASNQALLAISIQGSWDRSTAQSFIRSVRFTTPGDGITQRISIGLAVDSVGSNQAYIGGELLTYCSTAAGWYQAQLAACEDGQELAAISSRALGAFIAKRFGESWTAGRLAAGNWYWLDSNSEGTRFSMSSESSQGYEGAFVNWGSNEPAQGTCVLLKSDGKWYSKDDTATARYCTCLKDSCATGFGITLSAQSAMTGLKTVSISLDSDISVNYYLSFSDAMKNNPDAFVRVTIGSGDEARVLDFPVADIAVEAKLSSSGSSYRLSVPIKPKEMSAETVLEFFTGSETSIGSIGGEGKTNYNLRWYADRVILKKDSGGSYVSGYSQDLINLVRAMLSYGSAAQTQFGYNTDNPADSGLEDTSAVTDPGTIVGGVFTVLDSRSYTAALVSDSSTVVRLYTVGAAPTSVTVDGTPVEIESDAAGDYFEIPLAAQELGRVYNVDIDGQPALQFNALEIIRRLLSGSDEAAVITADRLYKLSVAANRYFGVSVPSANATEAIINTAYAYLANHEYTQYDQTRLCSTNFTNYPNQRRQLNASPSDATAQHSIYLDCSSFVFNVYREVFGTEAVRDAFGLGDKESWQLNVNTSRMCDDSTYDSIRVLYISSPGEGDYAQLRRTLQPGDLLIKYDYDAAHGHVVLWTGTGFIHCTGSSYNYDDGVDKTEADGAIYYVPASDFSAEWYDGFETLAILRPLNVLDSITEAGMARTYLGGLSACLTAECNGKGLFDGNGVVTGDIITYTLTLSNPAADDVLNLSRTLNYELTLPEGVSLVSGDTAATDVTLAPGQTLCFSCTAEVTGSAGEDILPAAAVCSASSGSFEARSNGVRIESSSFGTESASLAAAATALTGTTSEGFDTLNALIKSVLGSGFDKLGSSEDEWSAKIFSTASSGSSTYYYVKGSPDAALFNCVVSNYASGRSVLNYYHHANYGTDTRVRNITTDNLCAGDVVAVKRQSDYRYYVYDGNGSMINLNAGTTVKTENAQTVLSNLFNKTAFVVFRFCGRS